MIRLETVVKNPFKSVDYTWCVKNMKINFGEKLKSDFIVEVSCGLVGIFDLF